ncbi:hypothetical protein ACJMK2_042203 [Sinanodonta woodiana]|uniref:Uncharacterized protein n=1 Tax=Sinanodonta woodiana TaxID=1069815 RepID=A0ABD3W7M6_SINWO
MGDYANCRISEDDSATTSRSKLYEMETRNDDFQNVKRKTRESFRMDQEIVNIKFQQYLLRTESIRAVSDSGQTNAAENISGPQQYTSSSSSGQPQSSSQNQESRQSLSNGHLSGSDKNFDGEKKQQVQNSEILVSRPVPGGHYEKFTRGSNEHINKLNFIHPAKSRFGGSRTSMKSVDSESSTVSAGEVLYIPKDGSLRAFSEEQMATVFRMLHVGESTVKRLRMKNINGKKFANFTDTDLEQMGIKSPVVCYFRDRSKSSGSKTPTFML